MPVLRDTPAVTPAAEQAEYPILWLSYFYAEGRNPNVPVKLIAVLDNMRVLPDGKMELQPNGGIRYQVDDFFAECQNDPELIDLMLAIVTKLKAKLNV